LCGFVIAKCGVDDTQIVQDACRLAVRGNLLQQRFRLRVLSVAREGHGLIELRLLRRIGQHHVRRDVEITADA
jgi:hypothetical protein